MQDKEKKEMRLPENIIKERDKWDFADDREYYYYRGKLDAVKAIDNFIKSGGGSFRVLAYDYLNVDYISALDHGGLDISNYVYDKEPDLFRDATKNE